MYVLRLLERHRASIALLDPHPPAGRLRGYDFGLRRIVPIDPATVLAAGDGLPARVVPFPKLQGEQTSSRFAANRVIPLRRQRETVPATFVSGYDVYARRAAEHWRAHGVGTQPLLAAGVFSLSSVQTPIVTCLRLFRLLGPHVLEDQLPTRVELRDIVRVAGAGLDDPDRGRPAWYTAYYDYRVLLRDAIATGLRDDDLRWSIATSVGTPLGLGLAKLSFVLALVGNDVGCLDARILGWAMGRRADDFVHRIGRKRPDGSYSDATYGVYRQAELKILTSTPYYEASDPVGLARAQWMLWESLGSSDDRTHTHEELYAAVQDDRILWSLPAREVG